MRYLRQPRRPRSTRPRATSLAFPIAIVAAAALAASAACSSPAPAASPDNVGFALWSGAAVVPSGTTPAGTTVLPLGLGRYQINFPGLATTDGIVHVTAIHSAPHWCQAESWSAAAADEIVTIRCFTVGGVPDPSAFTAFFTRRSVPGTAGQYGYVDAQPGGAIISQYNSAGMSNAVAPLPGGGRWRVKLPGLSTPGPTDGSWQATAVNAGTGARCKIDKWSSTPTSQEAVVLCFDSFGAALDTRFTASFQFKTSLYGAAIPPKYFGYFWNTLPIGPPTTNHNSVLGPGVNTIASAGVGLSLVKFPAIGFTPDTVQVTAYGSTSDFCGLNTFWVHAGSDTIVRDVDCFTSAGAAIDTGFLVSANSIL